MPGPQKTSRSTLQAKKKPKIADGNSATVSPSESDDDVKVMSLPLKKKVRVICTDPDATESSSDEEQRAFPKRRVREILIPAHCFFVPSDSEDDAEKACLAMEGLHSLSQFSSNHAMASHSLLLKSVCPKRKSSKRLPILKKQGKAFLHARRSTQFLGVRRRRQGKWAAEIHDPAKGIRFWLGTHDSAEAAAKAYDMAAKKMRVSRFGTNSDVKSVTSSTSSINDDVVWDPHHQDLLCRQSCAIGIPKVQDVACLMKSPSSVLDNAAFDNCDSPNFNAAGKLVSVSLIDECPDNSGYLEVRSGLAESDIFGHGDVGVEASEQLEGVRDCSSMVSPTFLEETPFYGEFGQIFDMDAGRSSNADGSCLLDPMNDEFGSEECLGDMAFDLDPEALAWMNVPEVCGA